MKSAVIQLRQAELSDYKAIAALHADNWRKYYRGILSDHFLDHEVEGDRLDTWHKRLSAPVGNQIIIIALLENTIAGFSCLYLDEDPIFGSFMDNLHVSSHLQQSGIGKMLLINSAKTIFDKAVNKKMYLYVYASNKNAQVFYERMGGVNFETIERQNSDGTSSKTFRIIWNDVTSLT